ncbi:hypothetical protein STEG23_033145 [Scotinomys teguina]
MGYRAKQRIFGRRILNGRKTFKEMLNVLTHQRNANQNSSKIPSYTCQNGYDKKHRGQFMLERIWSKRNTPPVLVEMQIGTTTLESSMANPQKIGNHSSSRPSHTTLGHIPKECPVIPQGHMLNYVHSSIICNSQNLETT